MREFVSIDGDEISIEKSKQHHVKIFKLTLAIPRDTQYTTIPPPPTSFLLLHSHTVWFTCTLQIYDGYADSLVTVKRTII